METNSRRLRIVAFDPGINLGQACLEVNLDTKKIRVVDANTLIVDSIIDQQYEELLQSHDLTLARTYVIGKYVGKYCNSMNPDYACHETAFSSHGRSRFGNAVESFAKLRENILAIKLAIMNFDMGLRIFPVNPMTVKFAVVGKQGNDKDDISKALKAKQDLEFDIDIPFELLDQHAWDAVAIGFSFIVKRILGEPKDEHSKRDQRAKGNKVKRAR